MRADSRGREKRIYLDNCTSHLSEDECKGEFAQMKARLISLPPNATDLCQPADSFVIKDAWHRKWNEKKIELIEGSEWQNKKRKDGSWSGKLKNPGKKFFMSLAAECVREVHAQTDEHGIKYTRKAMIRCGLSLDVDGSWDAKQLFPHLQEIVMKYPDKFAGKTEANASGDSEACVSDSSAAEDDDCIISVVV